MHSSIDHPNLETTFERLFELTVALNATDIEEVQRVRHDVYCKDLGWEAVRDNGIEVDRYDVHSIHCLMRSKETGQSVGCTRLIVANPDDPHELLPFEESCREVLDRNTVDPAQLPRRTLGEVSRLAVTSAYRQRRGESSTPVSITDEDFAPRGRQTRFPFIPVGLYLGAAAIARHVGVEHVFVLTEPRLASHFSRIGFDIRTVGGAIEHRGARIPSLLSSSKVVAGLRPMMKPLYDVIDASVQAAFREHPQALDWMSARSGGDRGAPQHAEGVGRSASA